MWCPAALISAGVEFPEKGNSGRRRPKRNATGPVEWDSRAAEGNDDANPVGGRFAPGAQTVHARPFLPGSAGRAHFLALVKAPIQPVDRPGRSIEDRRLSTVRFSTCGLPNSAAPDQWLSRKGGGIQRGHAGRGSACVGRRGTPARDGPGRPRTCTLTASGREPSSDGSTLRHTEVKHT